MPFHNRAPGHTPTSEACSTPAVSIRTRNVRLEIVRIPRLRRQLRRFTGLMVRVGAEAGLVAEGVHWLVH